MKGCLSKNLVNKIYSDWKIFLSLIWKFFVHGRQARSLKSHSGKRVFAVKLHCFYFERIFLLSFNLFGITQVSLLLVIVTFIVYERNNLSVVLITENLAITCKFQRITWLSLNLLTLVTLIRSLVYMVLVLKLHDRYKLVIGKLFDDRWICIFVKFKSETKNLFTWVSALKIQLLSAKKPCLGEWLNFYHQIFSFMQDLNSSKWRRKVDHRTYQQIWVQHNFVCSCCLLRAWILIYSYICLLFNISFAFWLLHSFSPTRWVVASVDE